MSRETQLDVPGAEFCPASEIGESTPRRKNAQLAMCGTRFVKQEMNTLLAIENIGTFLWSNEWPDFEIVSASKTLPFWPF
jgi:hypothetical protein